METKINVGESASRLRRRFPRSSPMSHLCCIFKVPSTLRKHNEQIFVPSLVSIGPYHRDAQKFELTEKIKLWYLDCLITRAPTPNTTLECFFESIDANFKDCFECYGEEVKMSRSEFVEMLVVDGCFIVELFRRFALVVPTADDDPLFKMLWPFKALLIDLLLLENQLPWFVLNRLFDLTKSDDPRENCSLAELARKFFEFYSLRKGAIEVDRVSGINHLLDFVRKIMLFGSEKDSMIIDPFESIPCVTELRQAGIDFAVSEGADMMDITFEKGVLKIPPILVLDNAESLLRNLIAYEQCDRSLEDRITAYAAVFDNLVNTSVDLDYLRQKGITQCYLSSDDLSKFFNRLYNDAHLERSPYGKVSAQVNAYYRSRWPRWQARLARDYFNSPWSVISLIGAILILVLTFLQTVYTLLSK